MEQPLTTQAAILLLDIPQGSSLAGDQVQGAEGPKDQGKGKEKKSSPKLKMLPRIRMLQLRQKKQRSGLRKLIIGPGMLLPLGQVSKKIFLLPRRRLRT